MIINNLREVSAGVYHYCVKQHQLEQLKQGEFGSQTVAAAMAQGMCKTAAVIFVWTAIFERLKWRHRQRAYRYIYLDAGHIAENLALATVSLKLSSGVIGAFYDDEVNAILEIDGTDESTICMAAVGYSASSLE